MFKKSPDSENISIEKSLPAKLLFYMKKIFTQVFNDILTFFRVTLLTTGHPKL